MTGLLAAAAMLAALQVAPASQDPPSPDAPAIEEHVTVVGVTRTGRHLDDQPTRVEVLDREEIEEKMLMTPGDVVMLLNEMGGMRVQATSPGLGAASVRVQGMRGRYTRVLSDGLPLFGEVGGLGLLQIPPMDLAQVEVIKGVASALYGSRAMGGVINLISRRPVDEPEHEILLNQSTRGGTDIVAYLSGPVGEGWSASLLGGGHLQQAHDASADGWADLPDYDRLVLRPRVFWADDRGQTVFATAGTTAERREGGALRGRALETIGGPHVEALQTRHYDAGLVAQALLGERYLLTARGAAARARHEHRFGDRIERDRHDTLFAEATLRGVAGRHTWVAGAAVERETYAPEDVPRFAFAHTTPGVFGQHEIDLTRTVSLSTSARLDAHSEYGTFFSPRLAALVRAGRWISRFSAGTGFYAPTPLTEETEAAGLTTLTVPAPLRAERGVSGSVDLSRTHGPFTWTTTVFRSRISHPLHVERSAAYRLRNLPDPTTNTGFELVGTLRRTPFSVTATSTYVVSRETAAGQRGDVPLTPRHAAGLVAMWDEEDTGRIGIEWYYTGRQMLEENPYRRTSEPYMILGVLAERRFGRWRIFVNGENLTNVRQTRWDPLLRPSPGIDGRWTVDAWAPLEGRTINGGVRLEL